MVSDRTLEKVGGLAAASIEAVFTDPSYGKVLIYFLWKYFILDLVNVSERAFHVHLVYKTFSHGIFWHCFFLPFFSQFERGGALENIAQDVKKALEEEEDEESLKVLPKAVDTVRKQV